MMSLAIDGQPSIVVSRNRVNHISVQAIVLRQLQALIDDISDVVAPMCAIESVVARNDFSFYILPQRHFDNFLQIYQLSSRFSPLENRMSLLQWWPGFLCYICIETDNEISIKAQKQALQLFNDRQIRTAWDDKEEKWYFSIVNVVATLTDSGNPQTYWRVLKKRLLDEGDQTVTNCNVFKMLAADGKMRQTDVADQVQLFRLIQSIPSPKAEPFKVWMAQVASERIDEIQDPELAIDRGIEYYRKKGYGEGWIFVDESI